MCFTDIEHGMAYGNEYLIYLSKMDMFQSNYVCVYQNAIVYNVYK